jgi:uncharacterized protein (TIGR02246 family)
MSCRFIPLTLILTFTACQPQGAESVPDAEADRSALRELNATFTPRFNAEDADALVGLYAGDAVFFLDGGPAVMGKDSIRAAWDQLFTTLGDVEVAATVEEVVISGDLGYYWGYAKGTATDSEGNESPVDLKYLLVCNRQADGSWRISHHMSNSNVSPAAR